MSFSFALAKTVALTLFIIEIICLIKTNQHALNSLLIILLSGERK